MKTIIIILCVTLAVSAQNFVVEKISGEAKYLEGTSENWIELSQGQKLTPTSLVLTEKNALIKLRRDNEFFFLRGDAAIGLNHIKKVSLNDLILALTLDEIRNVPKIKNNSLTKNTAVYGSEIKTQNGSLISEDILGYKKINGAIQLSKNGYKESSIIFAKEIFRNYPNIAANFNNRVYFANLLEELELYNEAIEDYRNISKLDLTEKELNLISERIEQSNLKLFENN